MTIEVKNRMATPNKRTPPPAAVEAQPFIDTGTWVPPLNCPVCGRGMHPQVQRKRPTGESDCKCSLCGGLFVYTPPKVRAKEIPT